MNCLTSASRAPTRTGPSSRLGGGPTPVHESFASSRCRASAYVRAHLVLHVRDPPAASAVQHSNLVLVITHLFGEFLVNGRADDSERIEPQPRPGDKALKLLLTLNRVNLLRRAAQQGKAAEV